MHHAWMRLRPAAALALGAGAAASIAAVHHAAPAAAATTGGQTVRVSMKDFTFIPSSITVHAGDTVVWTYDESATDPQPNCESPFFHLPGPVMCPGHSTTAVDHTAGGRPLWDSGVHRAAGFPFQHTFATPGRYAYFCTVHGGAHPNNPITHMDGVVTVLAASGLGRQTATTPNASTPPEPAASTAATALPDTATGAGAGALLAGALAFLLAATAAARRR